MKCCLKSISVSAAAFLLLIYITPFRISFAQTAEIDGLRDKINTTNQIKGDLEKEIAKYESQIKELGFQKNTLTNTVKSIDLGIKKNETDIKLTQNKINSTQYRIDELAIDIGSKNSKILSNTEVLKTSVRDLSYLDDNSFIENLMNAEDISVVWNNLEMLKNFQHNIKNQTDQVVVDKNSLEDKKKESEKKKKELLLLKADLQDKKIILDNNKSEKNKLLADTKNQESNYKKILAEKKLKMEAFARELEGYENALKLAIDPSSIPRAGKGILMWPLDSIRITQKFGRTVDSVRLYASGTHNGVDFAASVGTPLKATLSGEIMGVGDTDNTCEGASYGKWILIKHDNGLSTLYGHMSLIKVVAGQRVTTGEVVGYTGNTGYSTGPHLHMTVYATQGVKIMSKASSVCRGTYTMPIADTKAYLDPLTYL